MNMRGSVYQETWRILGASRNAANDHRPITEGGRLWGGGVLDDVSGREGNSLGHRPRPSQIRRRQRLPGARVGPVAAVGDAQFVGGEHQAALVIVHDGSDRFGELALESCSERR